MKDRAEQHAIITQMACENAEMYPHKVLASSDLMTALGHLVDFDWRSVQMPSAEASSQLNSLLENGRTALRKAWGIGQ